MVKARLLLVFHNHQPVGNFDHVFAQASDECYMPLLETMERFPAIKFATHFSGPLLDWLEEHRPEVVERIKALVASGQMELLGGGYYEPMLSGIPWEDARGQLTMMKERLRERYGHDPSGMWLTERVWEPSLANLITGTGYSYALLDDNHFHKAGIHGELDGYYITEHSGRPLAIFPISQRLRYLIPYAEPGDAVNEIVRIAEEKGGNGVVLTYGDDGEKFGIWPKTKQRVWNEKWLERFLSILLERSDEVECVHPSQVLSDTPPKGRVYIPTASYQEMEEWVLTPKAHSVYVALRESLDFAKTVAGLLSSHQDSLALLEGATDMVASLPSDWIDSYLTFMRRGGRKVLAFARKRIGALVSGTDGRKGYTVAKAALLLISILERIEPFLERSPSIMESIGKLSEALRGARMLVAERSELELAASFIQGGIWQGFFHKYHESNLMHKRMVYVSERLRRLEADPQGIDEALLDRARDHLYQAQCNCGYWHGLFGGLYMPHLRHAIYEHLSRAEVYLDKFENGISDSVEMVDFDADSVKEAVLTGPELFAVVKPDLGGGLLELDIKARHFNITNVLTRRYEWYHDDLMDDDGEEDDGAAKSIHDIKQKIRKEDRDRVTYDFGPRFSFQDLFVRPEDASSQKLRSFAYRKFSPLNDPFAPYGVKHVGEASITLYREEKILGTTLAVEKSYTLERRSLVVRYEFSLPYGGSVEFAFIPESAFTLLAGDVENRRLLRNGAVPEGEAGNPSTLSYFDATSSLGLSSRWDGFAFSLSWERSTGAMVYPLETLSRDEAVARFTYQGTVFAPIFHLKLKESERERIEMRLEVELFPAER